MSIYDLCIPLYSVQYWIYDIGFQGKNEQYLSMIPSPAVSILFSTDNSTPTIYIYTRCKYIQTKLYFNLFKYIKFVPAFGLLVVIIDLYFSKMV